jgi:hypothetical protein
VPEEKTSPRARFARVKAEAARSSRYHAPFVLVFSPGECLPSDVGAFGRDAGNCYESGRFLACILTASAAVEIILNRDSRMRAGRRGWCHMNAKLMRTAQDRGLPVDRLLEGADDFKTDNSVTFLRLRNQIAHGNLDGIIDLTREGFALDYSRKAAKLALAHLNNADEFILEWFNTAPDVQQRRIRRGLWPT